MRLKTGRPSRFESGRRARTVLIMPPQSILSNDRLIEGLPVLVASAAQAVVV